MNEHLKSVRAYHDAISFSQAEPGTMPHMPDMHVIRYQALLMEAGSDVLKALKAGEMAEIMAGLTDLAYIALAAIAAQGGNVIDKSVSWRHDGFVLSVMKVLSDKIDHCASGGADPYSEVYCLCIHLARGFVNADFNKAFQMLHAHNMSRIQGGGQSIYDDSENIRKIKLGNAPDFSECLYE